MKKLFEEPAIEVIKLQTLEHIATVDIGGGGSGPGFEEGDEDW